MNDLDSFLPAIQVGDADAFGRWMATAEPLLRKSLRSFAASVDTEAVLQESLLKLWQVAPRFRPDGRPNGFLRLAYRVAKNQAISEIRRNKSAPVEPSVMAETLEATVDVKPPDPILRRVIAFCREKLRGKPAIALQQRLESMGREPDETLAERVGMTKNTFLQNFTRARKALRDCLRRQGVDIEVELA